MEIQRVYIGSWFQRTTLHLSEVYDFLKGKDSPLGFDKKKLQELRSGLALRSVSLKKDGFEHIHASTKKGLSFEVYEDGLIMLEKRFGDDVIKDFDALSAYHDTCLYEAMKYLFSLGATIPKSLVAAVHTYPRFVVVKDSPKEEIETFIKGFENEEFLTIINEGIEIYLGDKLCVINNRGEKLKHIERLVQELAFIRETKSQMHQYLNMHRTIWDDITSIKEKGVVVGKEVEALKARLGKYRKSVTMIQTRVAQMSPYIATRELAARNDDGFSPFFPIVASRYEMLKDTVRYMENIWGMTSNYVNSAFDVFSRLEGKVVNNSIKNLSVVITVGAAATLIGLFTGELPRITLSGVAYFVLLVVVGFVANMVLKKMSLRKRYSVEGIETNEAPDE